MNEYSNRQETDKLIIHLRYDFESNEFCDIINKAVEDVIKKLVSNPEFEDALQQKINSRVDTSSLEAELDRVPNCSPEKEKAIMEAFNHFQMI